MKDAANVIFLWVSYNLHSRENDFKFSAHLTQRLGAHNVTEDNIPVSIDVDLV